MKNAYPVMVSLTNPDEEYVGATIGSFWVGMLSDIKLFSVFAEYYTKEMVRRGTITKQFVTQNGQWTCIEVTFEDRVEYLVVGKDYYLPYFE